MNATEGSGLIDRWGRGTSDLATGIQPLTKSDVEACTGQIRRALMEDLRLALACDHGHRGTAGNDGVLISAVLVAPAGSGPQHPAGQPTASFLSGAKAWCVPHQG